MDNSSKDAGHFEEELQTKGFNNDRQSKKFTVTEHISLEKSSKSVKYYRPVSNSPPPPSKFSSSSTPPPPPIFGDSKKVDSVAIHNLLEKGPSLGFNPHSSHLDLTRLDSSQVNPCSVKCLFSKQTPTSTSTSTTTTTTTTKKETS